MSRACPSCQKPNVEEAIFCIHCGKPMAQAPALAPVPAPAPAPAPAPQAEPRMTPLTSGHELSPEEEAAAKKRSMEEEQSLVGQVVADRYKVVRLIGEGGMGRVYLAEQQMGNATRPVAIKTLRSRHGHSDRLRTRFLRECELVIKLSHPNTVQFYDFGELPDGRAYIVMEYIEGESLADAISRGPMAVSRVEHLVTQIAGSLSEAHRAGIVHRDLKPDNILLTTRGGEPDIVKVCDFGIAKHDEATPDPDAPMLTMEGAVLGTPPYMSPEQFEGVVLDERSDLYSLALIVYEMLAGVRPFFAPSPAGWAAKHLTEAPTPFEERSATRDLEPHRKAAVMRALLKDRALRQPTVKAFLAEFTGRPELLTTPTGSGLVASPRSADGTAPRPADGTAPTLPAMSGKDLGLKQTGAQDPGPQDPGLSDRVPAEPAKEGSSAVWIVLGVLLGILAVLLGYAWVEREALGLVDPPPEESADAGLAEDAGAPEPDAGVDAGPPVPTGWLRIVHDQKRSQSPANALGPPDGVFAVLPQGSTIVLELAAGERIQTDGSDGPDIFIQVDDARSGVYRVDVGVDIHQYTTVASDMIGSSPLDVDQFDIRLVRYVRIKNRGRRTVYLDAVGAYRRVEQ